MIKVLNFDDDKTALMIRFNKNDVQELDEIFRILLDDNTIEATLKVDKESVFILGECIEFISISNSMDFYSYMDYNKATLTLELELDNNLMEILLDRFKENLKGNEFFPAEIYDFLYEEDELTLYGEFTDLSEEYLKKLEKERRKDKKIALKKYILQNFSCNNPVEIQNKAIDDISTREDVPIEMLVQPFEEEYWENAAKILLKIGYPKVKEVIPNLFKWLEDLSKPGVKEIIELLKTVDRDVFINYFENAIKKAIKKNNKQLISNLSMFVDYFNIEEEDFTAIQVYPVLKEYRR